MVVDPKPEARHVATRSEWAEIAVVKHGPCRACGSLNIELHHLVPRSQRGSDVASNIIPLCSSCHRGFTDRSTGWECVARGIRTSLQADEVGYVLAKKSRWWLDRMYPSVAAQDRAGEVALRGEPHVAEKEKGAYRG